MESALRESRGSLSQAAILAGLAREFGYATSRKGSVLPLRSAVDVEHINTFDSDTLAAAGATDGPLAYKPDMEPHQMGTVLVSAIFEAFATVFRRKSARYYRVAGIAPEDIGRVMMSDDLVKILAQEASDVASHFLDICIRAIDYCPPVDMDMGEYLRALITADTELDGGRQMVLSRIAHAVVPAPRHFSGARSVHVGGRRALGATLAAAERSGARIREAAFQRRPGPRRRRERVAASGAHSRAIRDDAGQLRARCIWWRPVNRCRKTSRTPRRRSSSRCARPAASRRTEASCSTSWLK